MLDEIDRRAIPALTEAALNVILGKIPTDEQQLEKLRQHCDKLHELTKHSTSLHRGDRLFRKKGVVKVILDLFARHIADYS